MTKTEIQRIWNLCSKCAKEVYANTPPNDAYTRDIQMLLFGTFCQEGKQWERQRTPTWEGDVGGFSKWQVEKGSITESIKRLRNNPSLLYHATQWLFADPRASLHWVDIMDLDTILWAMRMDDNDKIGLLFCRLHYLRVPLPIPKGEPAHAAYWKAHYNTIAGKGTVEEYLANWQWGISQL